MPPGGGSVQRRTELTLQFFSDEWSGGGSSAGELADGALGGTITAQGIVRQLSRAKSPTAPFIKAELDR